MTDKIKCTKCEWMKPPKKFDKDPKKTNGKNSWCRSCRRGADVARSATKYADKMMDYLSYKGTEDLQ